MFRTKAGFSLVELMIVVAIMAILAAIAIPSFMRFSMRAKTAEATMNIAAIRTCLESYRAENDTYTTSAPCVKNPSAWAAGAGASTPQAWDTGTPWDELGFEPDGNVRYQYEVVATGTTFIITATGDLDEDSAIATFILDSTDPDYPKPAKSSGY